MRFLAIEHVLPSEVVTNEFRLNEVVNKSKDYFSAADLNTLRERLVKVLKLAKTEIRYVRSPDEKAFGLGVKAGMRALQTAGLDPTDIDLMIYVGVGRGFLEPATANVFQDALGLTKATCFDVLDACASWLRAVDVAHSFLKTKIYKRIMILNCECNREYGSAKPRRLPFSPTLMKMICTTPRSRLGETNIRCARFRFRTIESSVTEMISTIYRRCAFIRTASSSSASSSKSWSSTIEATSRSMPSNMILLLAILQAIPCRRRSGKY